MQKPAPCGMLSALADAHNGTTNGIPHDRLNNDKQAIADSQ